MYKFQKWIECYYAPLFEFRIVQDIIPQMMPFYCYNLPIFLQHNSLFSLLLSKHKYQPFILMPMQTFYDIQR
jgi:hypothetical protein